MKNSCHIPLKTPKEYDCTPLIIRPRPFCYKGWSVYTISVMTGNHSCSKSLLENKLEQTLIKANLLFLDELSYLSFNRHQSK